MVVNVAPAANGFWFDPPHSTKYLCINMLENVACPKTEIITIEMLISISFAISPGKARWLYIMLCENTIFDQELKYFYQASNFKSLNIHFILKSLIIVNKNGNFIFTIIIR